MPFDGRYTPLYLAAIAGLCGLGLRPRSVVEIPGPQRRLERIRELLGRCRFSFHDLSRVELSHGTPRFNMPLEPIFEHLRGRAPDLTRRYGGLYTQGAFAEFVAAAIKLTARLSQA